MATAKTTPPVEGTAANTPKKPSAKELYPDLWAQFEKLQARKAEMMKPVLELEKQRDALNAKIAPLEDEKRKITNKRKTLMPALAEVDRQISTLAKAMGGRSMADADKVKE